jgi:hypothetical protein
MSAKRTAIKHPYAAIEHRVIDSAAYADLTFSARSLLVLMVRQLTKDNNGHLQATFKYLHRFGFDSERTIVRTIAELIEHGFICRTRAGGFGKGASQYAVTWLPITSKEGLFLSGFKSCAWRDWVMTNDKTPPAKMQSPSCIFGTLPPLVHAKNAVITGAKNADNELVPCTGAFAGVAEPATRGTMERTAWASPLLIRHDSHLDRGTLNSPMARAGSWGRARAMAEARRGRPS